MLKSKQGKQYNYDQYIEYTIQHQQNITIFNAQVSLSITHYIVITQSLRVHQVSNDMLQVLCHDKSFCTHAWYHKIEIKYHIFQKMKI